MCFRNFTLSVSLSNQPSETKLWGKNNDFLNFSLDLVGVDIEMRELS